MTAEPIVQQSIDAIAIEVAVRLRRALVLLGHDVAALNEIDRDRTTIRLFIDDADPRRDRLGLRVVADRDSSWRLARISIRCNIGSGVPAWFGSELDGAGFVDYGRVAGLVSEDVRRA